MRPHRLAQLVPQERLLWRDGHVCFPEPVALRIDRVSGIYRRLGLARLASNTGVITFAGKTYAAGRRWAHASTGVTIVAGSVQLSKDGKVIRVHPIRHDRAKELGAFANPKGRPRRKNSATGNVA